MKNLNELNIANFPDGHKHLILNEKDLELTEIAVSIKSFDDLFLLAQLRHLIPPSKLEILRINYLLGARCDRRFSKGEAFDLGIICGFINDLSFSKVEVLKPHSVISLNSIKNSVEITVTKDLLQQCIIDNNLTDYSIISPDKGASQWITRELGNEGIVQCNKVRENGIVKSVTFDGEVKEDCIIVDDLCDGGATFIELAKELRIHGAKNIYLCVTHGIFSKGFAWLFNSIDKIYCTNSFSTIEDRAIITTKRLIQLKVC